MKLRIAQIAPLCESVPPKLYGGTERVVANLTDELVRMGHDVTLFASGDSVTTAKLVGTGSRALRLDPDCWDEIAPHVLQLEQVMQRADEFDVLHFHLGYLHFPLVRRSAVPHVTTQHGRLDVPRMKRLFTEYADLPLVSISDSQASALPFVDWRGTVYHGLPLDLHRPSYQPGDYFAFLGRFSPEKRPDRAIAIAKALGVPLRMAAKVDKADAAYYRDQIKPLLDDPLIEFVGEIDEEKKAAFLGGARALLFPIDWPEPFGLVMIEAMACGTPVVAFGCGSVPELIDDGVTGYVVSDLNGAIAAAAKAHTLDRRLCRAAFERRFSAARMARDYLAVYADVMNSRRTDIERRAREAAA
jgi:glycosyltransferase involved in cell wall biosynthesis